MSVGIFFIYWSMFVMKALTKLTMKTIKWSLDLSGVRQTFVAHIYVCFPARGHTSHSRPHLRVVKHDGIISLPPRGETPRRR